MTRAPQPRRTPWVSLTFREYRLLFAGLCLGQFGMQVFQVATLWQVYELSRSAFEIGLTGLFQALPLFVLGLFGGAVADAVDRKRLIVYTQAGRLAIMIGLTWVTLAGTAEVWHVYAAILLGSALWVFDRPARQSLIPVVVPREYLFNAIGFLTTVNQVSRLVAPSLAGVLIAAFGVGSTYVLVVVSIGAVILVTVPMVLPKSALDERPEMSPRMIVEGFSFLWNNSVLMGLILLDTALTFFGAFRPLMPIFAEEVLHAGPTGLGLLLAAPGAGAVTGAAIVTLMGDRGQRERWVLWGTVLYGLLIVPFGQSQWLAVSMALGFALGLLDAVGATIRQTMVQVLTPDPLRGRVTSIHQMFSMGAPSLGYVQIGITASVLGAGPALVLAGVLVMLCAGAVGLWWRRSSGDIPAPGYPTRPPPPRPAPR